jgi:hypothetical protein
VAPTNIKNIGRGHSHMNKRLSEKIKKLESYDLFSKDDIEKLSSASSTEIQKIVSWKILAKNAGVAVQISDYNNNEEWNKINSLYDYEFYKIRYSKYDYHKIYENSVKEMNKKRGSIYDPENIAIRNNVSLEEAIKISEERKEKTKITRENLIKKYGTEVGEKKYQDFVNKSISTIDNYKKRYGPLWRERWDHFLATRDSSSLKACVAKYGEDGERIFAERVLGFKKSSDIKYYVEKYGEEEGGRKFEELNQKKADGAIRSWSFEEFSKKHKEDGLPEEEIRGLFLKKIKSRSSKTIEYFLQKGFSLEESKELRIKSLESLYRNSEKNKPVSKESINFFSQLQKTLNRQCVFGSKKNEFLIKKSDKLYFFDFFDSKSNTIIEYNGSIYHAPEILSEVERANWKNKYGLSWNEVYNKDKQKIEAAKSAGYNIIVVWDYEVRSKTKLKEKIKELVNILGISDES